MLSRILFKKIFIYGFLLVTVLLNSCSSNQKDRLTIAVAANLQFVIGELVENFKRQSGIDCEVIIGSSGKLTAQIIEGAPFDLFMSADLKYPKELYKKGFSKEEPVIYAFGTLILWTVKEGVDPDLKSLSKRQIKHIAMGNPKIAPYGVSAMEVIRRIGIEKQVKEKLVFGESVSQTNQFIISEAADLGFTSKSVVMSHKMKERGSWKEIDQSLYQPIAQGLVVLEGRDAFKPKAIKFRDYILSVEGKEILHKFGYDIEY